MSDKIFFDVVNMSITGSFAILIIILVRLLLRKAPKVFSYGIEYSACVHEPSPEELVERMERFYHLWNALNSWPEIQGRRVDAHLIEGKSYREIARGEGVDKSAVRCSVLCGIESMKKYLRKNL